MSRATAATIVLALTGALTLLQAPGPIANGGEAAAADCTWQRHSKRVVKQVRRDGRARRLVRRRHWWTCNPLAVPAVVAIPPIAPPATAPPPAAEPKPTVARLGVKADEYSFTLSRPSVVAGEAIVELNNQGEDPHNLKLQLEGSDDPPLEVAEAGPLEHRVGHFTLAAGSYRLWCSLLEHDELGMHATLQVETG